MSTPRLLRHLAPALGVLVLVSAARPAPRLHGERPRVGAYDVYVGADDEDAVAAYSVSTAEASFFELGGISVDFESGLSDESPEQ